MSDEHAASIDLDTAPVPAGELGEIPPDVPDYCQETYWWAYLHPRAVWFWEREWIVNLILWGNMRRLTEAAIASIEPEPGDDVLQVACVYGMFSERLASHLRDRESRLHIVDVAPIQLDNAQRKLAGEGVKFHHQDSTRMRFEDAAFSSAVVYFLLHEQPEHARRETIQEALRVTRPGGRVVFVDYHKPTRINPLRYVMHAVLRLLEPFALDLWRQELGALLAEYVPSDCIETTEYAGGLYQRAVVVRPESLDR